MKRIARMALEVVISAASALALFLCFVAIIFVSIFVIEPALGIL